MNAQRRKRLEAVVTALEDLQMELASITEEEQESYDNLPEGIQESERGDTMYENISDLEDLDQSIEDLKSNINDIIER